MKKHLLLASLFISSTAFAANFGGASTGSSSTGSSGGSQASGGAVVAPPVAPPAVTPPAVSVPQVADIFKVVKPDGTTIIQQGTMSSTATSIATLTLSESDAIAKGVGKCGFNVKYDEISSAAAINTTNRLFSNDKPIAINSKIDLAAGVLKTIWTQPYLFAGMNNVRIVVNADSATPSTKWIRIYVSGTCGGTPAVTLPTPPTATPPAKPPVATPPVATTPEKPPVSSIPPAIVKYSPGSQEWNNLNIVYGYSNFATTQLKGKGYSRYDELVKLNVAATSAFKSKSIERGAYTSIMTSWNTFVTDPVFQTMMKAVVPTAGAK